MSFCWGRILNYSGYLTEDETVRGENEGTEVEQGEVNSVLHDRVVRGVALSMEWDSHYLQDMGSGKYVSQRKFHLMARDHKDVFCFYRVLIGNDRGIFVKYLVPLINEVNFERHNLATGGISFQGWMQVMKLCARELEHYYRIFEKQKCNLFYVAAVGHGPVVDILLSGDHITRVCVEGRYPKLDLMDLLDLGDRVVYGLSSSCPYSAHDLAQCVEHHRISTAGAGTDEREYVDD